MSTPSFATVGPGNMPLGPCRVNYNGVDLGGTLGNVTIKRTYHKAEKKADQYGVSVLDRVVSGLVATVETELTEMTVAANWKVLFPNADLITNGGVKSIVWRSKVGSNDLSLAHQLILHPLANLDSDKSADHTFPLAVSMEDSQFVFSPTEQTKCKIVFNIYLDTSSNPAVMMFFGDPANGLINAVAGTPVFTGTGNGTMTGVTPNPATDETETITAIVVGVAGANKSNWFVSGSLSGPLGILELTSGTPGSSGTFSSPVISFTITDGSTDFVVNDQFQIPVTGANYS